REKYATVNENDDNVSIIQEAVVTEPVQDQVSKDYLSNNTVVSNDINANNGVDSSQVISASNNEVEAIPDVVATPGESVTSVVNTEEIKDIPVQEVSNVVIPSINQDGNNTI